jgi:PRTRC genetic system ThiF family protein
MYRLDNGFVRGHFAVTVVGCGGTGGFVAEGLCRILPAHASLVLVDHDRVEEHNLGRQNFTRAELGRLKSEALAERLAREFGRPVAYSTLPVAEAAFELWPLVIGCVDNGPARRDIAEKMRRGFCWWVDAGNGENYGQILIGSVDSPVRGSFSPEKGICRTLPLPTIQRPDLLAQKPPVQDCAQAVASGEQSPVVNQAMAALVVEVVRRLIEGTCPWMQLCLDLEVGTLQTLPATPEAVAKLMGVSVAKLLE